MSRFSSTTRHVLKDPYFWFSVITGWTVYHLLWQSLTYRYQTKDCPPCEDNKCPTCNRAEVKTSSSKSMAKNAYYRDYPWKSTIFAENKFLDWRLETNKHRNGMQNEDPRVGINGMWRQERDQVHAFIQRSLNTPSNRLVFERIIRKDRPFYGTSYLVKEKSQADDGHYKTAMNEVRRRYLPGIPTLLGIEHVNEKEIVHIITPLSRVTERFHKFLKRLEENVYSARKKSYEKLIFVIFGVSNSEDSAKTISALQNFQLRNPQAVMQHAFVNGDFNRAIGLDTGVKMCPDDSLLLFLDVDLSITPEFLNRIRSNTVRDERVVFPIMFSQFDPEVIDTYGKKTWISKKSDEDQVGPIEKDKGFWIHYAFGVASMYRSDYHSVDGFPLDIVGWGGEDVSLFKKLIASDHLDVMSTVDPDLIHIYHSRSCDVMLSSDQYRMCIGALSETIGSQTQIGGLYLEYILQQHFTHDDHT